MSKSVSTKEKSPSIFFKAGDGKIVKVDRDICRISEYLAELFSDEDQVYFENATERTISLLVDFYNEFLGLTTKQIEILSDPKKYIGSKKSDPDLVRLYNSYKKLAYVDLFGLLKIANDTKVKYLEGILTHIIARIIESKGVDELDQEFALNK